MRAILYRRVSTKKQDLYGFSLPEQEIRLRTYCLTQGYEIVAEYEEKYSAKKDFHRPAFQKMLHDIKSGKLEADVFVCIKGDRYSRNTRAAMDMLDIFKKLNLRYEQIEGGNYDLSIPENLIPHYLNFLIPEVENKRRALNTFRGMRQARRQGKWVGTAPKGYVWVKVDKRSVMVADELQAGFITKAFEEFSRGIYKIEELRKKLIKEGLKNCSKNQFPNILRNRVYIGEIYIPAFENEPEQIVKGIHPPLTSEIIFYQVQALLSNKKVKLNKVSAPLILRRNLICIRCGNLLTGSKSKSRNGNYHYYYHCNSKCGTRYRADIVNGKFELMLQQIQAPENLVKMYKEILVQRFSLRNSETTKRLKYIRTQIDSINQMKTQAEDSFFKKEISVQTFGEVNARYRDQLISLKVEQEERKEHSSSFQRYLEFGTLLIQNLYMAWTAAENQIKQKIVGSIFPKGITFTGSTFRTTTPNAILIAFQCKSELLEVFENEKATLSDGFFQRALPPGLEPGTL